MLRAVDLYALDPAPVERFIALVSAPPPFPVPAPAGAAQPPHLSDPSYQPAFAVPTPAALTARASAAFASELQHERVQKAKFKAVEQLLAYEGFEEMVRGAHLQPMNLTANPLHAIADSHVAKQKQGTLVASYGVESGAAGGVGDASAPSAPVSGAAVSVARAAVAGTSAAGLPGVSPYATLFATATDSSSTPAAAVSASASASAIRAEPTADTSFLFTTPAPDVPMASAAAPVAAATAAAVTARRSVSVLLSPGTPAAALESVVLSPSEFEQAWSRSPDPLDRAALLLSLTPAARVELLGCNLGFDRLAALAAALDAALAALGAGSEVLAEVRLHSC